VRRGNARARGRQVALSSSTDIPELAAQIRTETLSILRTERRSALDELCLALPPEDRELLVLRVARSLPWRDVAIVLSPASLRDDEHALHQECARLRKRFQLLRERLRALGKERGLL
jgi:RNA polymerase sigma-70 factor (ECF subfamily)